jgi:hypothetical protein
MDFKVKSKFPQVSVPDHIAKYGYNPNPYLYDAPVTKYAQDYIHNNINNPYFMYTKDTVPDFPQMPTTAKTGE